MKSVNEFYYKLKEKSELPIGIINFIIIDDVGYHFGKNIWIDYNNDKDSILALTKVTKRNDFFTFVESEEGIQFINENYESLKNTFLENLYKEDEVTEVIDGTEEV
jgi:hypothetical protein